MDNMTEYPDHLGRLLSALDPSETLKTCKTFRSYKENKGPLDL